MENFSKLTTQNQIKMKINLILLLLVSYSLGVMGQNPSSTREIREVRLSGRGYELGLQHGKLLKKKSASWW